MTASNPGRGHISQVAANDRCSILSSRQFQPESKEIYLGDVHKPLATREVPLPSSSHDQDTIHAEKGRVEMYNFRMAALMFLTGHGIKARTHAIVEITHFPTQCIIRIQEALSLWHRASQALMVHFIGKCAISAQASVLPISPTPLMPLYHHVTSCQMI